MPRRTENLDTVKGLPLTKHEHDLLYERAMQGSVKDAARVLGREYVSVHHTMASIFAKLGVEDLVSAFWAMGWLHPLPYGVSSAEARHEKLVEGNHTEADFWARMHDATERRERE